MSSSDQNTAPAPKDLSYPNAVEELESIVKGLDDGVIDVDTLSGQFQRAIDIIEELDARIMRTKEQVARLTPRLEALSTKTSPEAD